MLWRVLASQYSYNVGAPEGVNARGPRAAAAAASASGAPALLTWRTPDMLRLILLQTLVTM